MRLPYGTQFLDISVPAENILQVVEHLATKMPSFDTIIKERIVQPIGKPRLRDIFRKNRPGDVVILVADRQRSIAHYPRLLEYVIDEAVDGGVDEKNISFVVAHGTHRLHTDEENESLFESLPKRFSFTGHDCHGSCTEIGRASTGLRIAINRRVQEADFVIATGKIDFHYLAGFSGGRKAVLPGIASYETIQGNHSKLRREGVAYGSLEKNVIHQEMEEAARLSALAYLFNVIETPQGESAGLFCGDPVLAFNEGTRVFFNTRRQSIARPADCVIVSPGDGAKEQETFYVAHKCLNSVRHAVRKGGFMILVAACPGGVGNDEFRCLMKEKSLDDLISYPEKDIHVGGHRAFQTAQLLHDYRILVVSDLAPRQVEEMHFTPMRAVSEALSHVREEFGPEFSSYIIPDGRAVFPVREKTHQVCDERCGESTMVRR